MITNFAVHSLLDLVIHLIILDLCIHLMVLHFYSICRVRSHSINFILGHLNWSSVILYNYWLAIAVTGQFVTLVFTTLRFSELNIYRVTNSQSY